jgi:hypothetical protein
VNLASYAYDDTVTPDFIDISATGTPMEFVPGDGYGNESGETTAPFPLRFYGQTSTALCLSIDGLLQFADATCIPPQGQTPPPGFSFNQDIPSTTGTEVPTYLAPMWMNLDDTSGDVYVQALGIAPNRTFVVEWFDLPSYVNGTTTATFEIVFAENSDTIRFEYLTTAFGDVADNGAWATVGLQADPLGLYTKYSYYQPSLRPDSAIEWTFTPAASAAAESGSVQISAGDPTLALAQTSITAVADNGGTATRTLSIANSGNRDLHWSLAEAPGGARAHFPKTPRYVVPPVASDDITRPPGSAKAGFFGGQRAHADFVRTPHAPFGDFGVPAFGVSSLRPGLVTFDALDPLGTYTPINDSSDWIYSASFIGNDFSKLYVIINDGWENPPGTYGTVDVATGVFTSLGHLTGAASSAWVGLTQDPQTGLVYAVNYTDTLGSANGTLYTLDLATGAATRIGAIDGPGVNPIRFISGIAISPAGLMYGLDLYGQSLIAIDKSSGAASVVESLGLNVQYVQDIKFDERSGDLYWAALYVDDVGTMIGEMRVIDPLTAASQAIGAFPAAGEYPFDEMSALAIATPSVGCSEPGDVPWLSVTPGSGTIAAGAAAQDVTVTMDGSGLDAGLHQAMICVYSDDPHHRAAAVSVQFAVDAGAPLYDQGVDATTLRAFNNTVVAPDETQGMSSEGADDFVVGAGGWSVVGFRFSAYGRDDANSPPSTVNMRILADNGNGRPSDDVVCSSTNIPAIALDSPTTEIGVWLPAACDLQPGTYWVAWSFADVNIASPVIGFWGESETLHNQPAVWRNPGGLLSATCTAWSTFDQCPGQFEASARDFGFTVLGTAAVDCADVIFSNGFEDSAGGCPGAARD